MENRVVLLCNTAFGKHSESEKCFWDFLDVDRTVVIECLAKPNCGLSVPCTAHHKIYLTFKRSVAGVEYPAGQISEGVVLLYNTAAGDAQNLRSTFNTTWTPTITWLLSHLTKLWYLAKVLLQVMSSTRPSLQYCILRSDQQEHPGYEIIYIVEPVDKWSITCHEVGDDNEHGVWDEPERHNINQYFGNKVCWHPVVSTGILMAEIGRGVIYYLNLVTCNVQVNVINA